jgi:hypothetical protein
MRGAIQPLPQYVFMACCLVKHRDNFTFTFAVNTDVYCPFTEIMYLCGWSVTPDGATEQVERSSVVVMNTKLREKSRSTLKQVEPRVSFYISDRQTKIHHCAR